MRSALLFICFTLASLLAPALPVLADVAEGPVAVCAEHVNEVGGASAEADEEEQAAPARLLPPAAGFDGLHAAHLTPRPPPPLPVRQPPPRR